MPSVVPGCPTELVSTVCASQALPRQKIVRTRLGPIVLKQFLSYRPLLRTRSQGGLYATALTPRAARRLPRSRRQLSRWTARESNPAGNPAKRSRLPVDSGSLPPDWILSLPSDNWQRGLSPRSGVGRCSWFLMRRHKGLPPVQLRRSAVECVERNAPANVPATRPAQ